MAPLRPEGELRVGPADPPVLRLQRRRRRPVRDRRRATRADGVRPRGDPERHHRHGADLAEPAPRLHARVRRGRRAGELDHVGRRPRCSRSRTSRPTGSRRRTSRASTTGRSTTSTSSSSTPRRTSSTTRARPGQTPFTYDGEGGIPLGGYFRRALFAWRFRDANLLISGQVDSGQPDPHPPQHRGSAPKATLPFLTLRRRSVPGRDVRRATSGSWTPTRRRTRTPTRSPSTWPTSTAGLLGPRQVNYMRNSVKAVVDAYDGIGDVLRRSRRAHHAGVGPRLPRRVHADRGGARGDPRPTSATRRTSSRRRPSSSPTTTSRTRPRFYRKQDFWEVPGDPTLRASSTRSGRRPRRPRRARARGSSSRTTSCCGCRERPRSGSIS